jgi:hypothetical protein
MLEIYQGKCVYSRALILLALIITSNLFVMSNAQEMILQGNIIKKDSSQYVHMSRLAI